MWKVVEVSFIQEMEEERTVLAVHLWSEKEIIVYHLTGKSPNEAAFYAAIMEAFGDEVRKFYSTYKRKNPYRFKYRENRYGSGDWYIEWLVKKHDYYVKHKKHLLHLSMYNKLNRLNVKRFFIPDLIDLAKETDWLDDDLEIIEYEDDKILDVTIIVERKGEFIIYRTDEILLCSENLEDHGFTVPSKAPEY